MRPMNMASAFLTTRRFLAATTAVAALALTAHAAAPGITGPTFNLTAQQAYLTQPDGQAIYSWGYGCAVQPSASSFAPAAITGAFCNTMQVPGPTLIVTEGQTVTVTLTNGLPTAAGNTSIVFPGFTVTTSHATSCVTPSTCDVPGLITEEAVPGGSVTYSFVATSPGTRSYYSGTQSDLQIEMGLYGAVIVLPASVPSNCNSGLAVANRAAETHWGENDFRLAHAAYDHPKSCYDREYLFQFSEIDPRIHSLAAAQVSARKSCIA